MNHCPRWTMIRDYHKEQEALAMDPKKEREYADEIPDDEETERPEANDRTYRDGSLQNECWAGEE